MEIFNRLCLSYENNSSNLLNYMWQVLYHVIILKADNPQPHLIQSLFPPSILFLL